MFGAELYNITWKLPKYCWKSICQNLFSKNVFRTPSYRPVVENERVCVLKLQLSLSKSAFETQK